MTPSPLPLLWFRSLPLLLLLSLLFPVEGNAQTKTLTCTCSPSLITPGENVTVTVTASPAPTSDFSVYLGENIYGVTIPRVTIPANQTTGSGTVTNTGGASGRTITLNGGNSPYSGPSCSFTVSGGGGGPPTDPQEALAFSKSSVTVDEGSTATYSVSLATRPSSTVTVSVAVSTASGNDSDITVNKSSLTFTTNNWSTGQDVTVSAAEDDDLTDGSATIGHTASGGGYTGVKGNVTATEDDNDTAALSFSKDTVTVTEGSTATYSVRLAYKPSASVTVAVARSSGDSDLTVNKSSLTFTTSNWDTGQEITVSAAEDGDGLDGSATIGHTASNGGYSSVTGDVTATEADNDRAISVTKTSVEVDEGSTATYKVSLATRPSSTVTVAVARSSGDEDLTVNKSSLSFTTNNWNTGQTVTVSAAQDDDLTDGSATIGHTAAGGGYAGVTKDVTATEDDDDTAALSFSKDSVTVTEGGTATYKVSLAYEPSATVTVTVAKASGGDSDLTLDKSSLSFTTNNWSTGQTVTVSAAQDDDGIDGSATIGHTAAGGGYGSVTGNVTATEDDDDPIGLSFSRTSFSVFEGGTAKYTVVLDTKPSASVTVSIARKSGGDTDLTVNKSSLTFTTTNWSTTQEVTVSAREDLDALNGTATFGHTAAGGDYGSVSGNVTPTESDNDTAGLTLSNTSLSVPEGGTAKYTVALATQPSASVTVSVARKSGGDTGLTVNKSSLTFTTTNWYVTQEVTVSAAADDDAANGSATIGHTAAGGDYAGVTEDVTATEADDDSPALSFTKESVTVTEGSSATYKVSLATQPSASVRVAPSPTGDGDLTVSPASLTFTTTNWSTGQTVRVSAAEDDDIADGTATIGHTASGGDYTGVKGNVTATEDDDDSPALSFSKDTVTVTEGSSATYTVSLAYKPNSNVAVVVVRASGDGDLTVSPASLTFTTTNWSTGQTVTIEATPDDDLTNGSATIRHTAFGGGYGSVAADVTTTEDDNDTAALSFSPQSVKVAEGSTATYKVSLSHKPSAKVTVSISDPSGDSDLSVTSPSGKSLSFTTTNWSTGQTVTVSAAEDDDLADGSATIGHTASGGGYGSVTGNVTATEDDNDTPDLSFTRNSLSVSEGSTASYKVSLSYKPSASVTVTVSDPSGDSDLTVDKSSLSFTTTNWSTGQTVTVSAAQDDDVTNGRATITHTASGGGYTGVSEDVTATEADDDTPALSFTEESVTVTEGSTATYKVSLAYRPSSPVAVVVGRASGDTDLTASPTSLSFTTTNWSTGQTVTVSAREDDDLTDGSATIRHTAFGGGYGSVTGDVTATEDDNDTAALSFSPQSVTVDEGSTATYKVSLSSQPSASVTVTISDPSGDGDLTVTSPSDKSLSFTTTNWSTGQTVTVSAAEDDDLTNGTATISHTAAGGGYGSVTGNVTATEDDDDTAALSFSKQSVMVAEGSTATYSVSLAYKPSASVAVSISKATGGDSDITVDKSSLSFTTTNWETGQTVTLSAAEDDDLSDGSATIGHTASGGGYTGVKGNVAATEDDNDTAALSFSKQSVMVTEGSTATYSVRLAYRPSASVAVSVLRKSGDKDLSPSPALLVFTATNWSTAQQVTVTAAEDDDGADGSAVIGHAALGGGYDSVTGDVTATEDDNDSAALVFSTTALTVPEGDSASYTVALGTQPSADVAVSIARSSGDGNISITSPSGKSLTFTTSDWSTPQRVTLSAAQDNDLTSDSATISHTASGGGYTGVSEDITATEKDDDAPNIVLSETSLPVSEGGTASYTVRLSIKPSADVAVSIARSSGDGDLTVKPASLTFTASNWNLTQQVTVSAAADDDIVDGEATIGHTASGGGYNSASATLAVTEDDDDTPALTLSTDSVTVAEGSTATYTLELAYRPSGPVAVVVSRSSGDSDISAAPALLSFTVKNWDTPQTVTLSAGEDNDSANSTAVINHSALGGGYGSVAATLTATEKDNDSAGFSFSRKAFFVSEGSSTTYTLRLQTQPSGTVTVSVSRASGGDTDLTVLPASLSFTTDNWDQGQQITVSAAEDEDAINGEATINHSALGGGYGGVTGAVRVTESDNDAPGLTLSETEVPVPEGSTATYKLSLATEPSGPVTVSVSRSSGDEHLSTTTPSLSFTADNWDAAQEVTLSAAPDDDAINGTATFSHTAAGGGYGSVTEDVTATEADDDTVGLALSSTSVNVPEGSTATYTVSLKTQPSGTVTVSVSRAQGGDTDLTVDKGSLSFTTTNWSTAQDVTVSAGEDEDGANGEATFTHTALGGGYAGVTGEVAATEVDNDTAGLVLSPSSLSIDEDGGQDTYTVRLATIPSGPVRVAIASGDTTVATALPSSLSFTTANWDRPRTVRVTGVDDSIDSDRATRITHTASGADYGGVTAELAVTLIDDDTAGVIVDPEELQLAEGGQGSYTLALASEPLSPVAISIARLGENVENLDWDPKRLTFSAADWNLPQTVTVSLEQDADNLAGVALMRHTAASPDRTYSGIGIDDVEIVIGDDDQVVTSAVLTLSDEEIAEGEATALVTVTATLDAVTTTDLSISLSLGGTATAEDYSVGGVQSIEIAPGKQSGETTLTFVPVDDALVEGEETIIFNGASQGLTVSQATLALIDDDVSEGDAVGALSVDIDQVSESARDTLVTVTLTLEEGFSFDELRTFEVSVRGSGDEAAVDFAPVQPLTLTLLSNLSVASSTFILRPENDLVDERDETLTLSVVSSPLPVTPATITLVDDDAAPPGISLSVDDPDIVEGDAPTGITVTATVDGGTTFARTVNVALAFGGTATEGSGGDYTVSGPASITIPPGARSAEAVLTFTPIDDSRDELDETIEISGTTPGGPPATPTAVTLIDNDESLLTLRVDPRRVEEGAGPVTLTLTVAVRSGAPYEEPLSVALEFGGTAAGAADYTLAGPFSFTLPAGEIQATTTLTVTPIDDSLDEPDETLEIIGNAGISYTSTAVVLIIDNDIPPARIHLTASPATLVETDPPTRVLLEARVEGNTAFSTDTEIALALEGSAVATIDYDAGGINDPLILPAGRLSVARELNLTPIDDPHPEGAEEIVISGAAVVRVVPAGITLLDDDGADLNISFTQAEYTANEYGAPAAVTVTVRPAADRREVIDLTFSHRGGITPDDYRGLPDELVFEPGDDAVTFTVEALPDQAFESGERIHLRLASLSTQISFQPLAAATVLFVERRSAEDFSRESRTVLALSSRAWSDSVQSALEERFARARQTEQWGSWQPGYEGPRAASGPRNSPALLPQVPRHSDRIIPGDWLTAWRQKNERRNMGLVEPRLSLSKILKSLKGWSPVLWTEGATHHFSGHAQALDYRGGFRAGHVGLDLHSGKRTLIGASVMRGQSSMDYSNGEGLDGSTTATLYTIHPYIHFEARDRVTVWMIGGLGFAPLSLQELDRDHDLSGSARMAAGGVRIRAKHWDRLELAIRGDGDIAWIGARLPAESVTLGGHAGRLRLLAELSQTIRVFGQDLIAAGEAGGRLDRGGAHRGAGADAGGRISWRKPEKGLDFSVHANSLLWHQSAFQIWGAGIQASWDPGAEKRGLVLRFASGRGIRGGKTRLFQEPLDRLSHAEGGLDTELELGYGTGVGSRLLTLTFRLQDLSGWTAAVDLR